MKNIILFLWLIVLSFSGNLFADDGVLKNSSGTTSAASGAVPINADGSATTSAQINSILPTTSIAPYYLKPWNRRFTLVGSTGTASFSVGDTITANGGGSVVLNLPTASDGPSVSLTPTTPASRAVHTGNLIYRTGRNITFNTSAAIQGGTSSFRGWMGLTDQIWDTMATNDTPAGNFVGFLITTNVTAGFTNNAWVCNSKDNVAQKTVVTTQALDSNYHKFSITFNDSVPNVVFQIDGSTVATITTNLPSASTNLRLVMSAQSFTGSTPKTTYEYIVVESDR